MCLFQTNKSNIVLSAVNNDDTNKPKIVIFS